MTQFFNISYLLILGAFLLIEGIPARAEGETGSSSQPAPSSQDDRKSGASKASAMALAQAAMAQVMCLKMMADAQKEGDSEKMAMAAAMCAQAAALAANGKENEEGSKKSSSPPPMGAVPTFEKAKLDTEPKSDVSLNLPPTEMSKPSTMQLSQTPSTTPEKEQPLASGNVFQEDKTFQNKNQGNPIEETKDIASSSISLRNSGTSQNLGNGFGAFGASGNDTDSLKGNSPFSPFSSQTPQSSEDSKAASKKSLKSSSGGMGENGGGFDDLMARYMGGVSGGGALSGGRNGGIIDLAYGLQKPGFKTRNIFEFASDQYKLASQHRSVKMKASEPPTLFRALSSP